MSGILYGASIGDAISLGTEFMTHNEVLFHYWKYYDVYQLEMQGNAQGRLSKSPVITLPIPTIPSSPLCTTTTTNNNNNNSNNNNNNNCNTLPGQPSENKQLDDNEQKQVGTHKCSVSSMNMPSITSYLSSDTSEIPETRDIGKHKQSVDGESIISPTDRQGSTTCPGSPSAASIPTSTDEEMASPFIRLSQYPVYEDIIRDRHRSRFGSVNRLMKSNE